MSLPLSKVLFVFTGGTIAMKADPVTGARPALSGYEILAHDPEMSSIAEAEVVDFGRYPGPHATPRIMLDLSERLRAELVRPETAGALVTHGIDTLEETAYLLDLRHTSEKPVVVVGAMRSASELSYDRPANLRAAARVVIDPEARGLVIEGTGRGNVTVPALGAIQRALDAGVPGALVSRCAHGRVLDLYGYPGGGRDLRSRGVLFAGTLTGPKARIRLMLALGATGDPAAIRGLIESGFY